MILLIQEDEALAAAMDALSLNQRHALIVRMGEKRIWELARAMVAEMVAELGADGKDEKGGKGKRKAEGGAEGGRKKRKDVG